MNEIKVKTLLAVNVSFINDKIFIELNDGRMIGCPLSWFPLLEKGTEEERNDWRLIAKGVGIHWEKLDEDISVNGLFKYKGSHFNEKNYVAAIGALLAVIGQEIDKSGNTQFSMSA